MLSVFLWWATFLLSCGCSNAVDTSMNKQILQKKKWSVFLRIPRTGSTFLSESVVLINPDECHCQTKSAACSKVDCISDCKLKGCRTIWKDTPHADYLDLQKLFLLAKLSPDMIFFFTCLRNPVQRLISEYQWVSTIVPNSCAANNNNGKRYAWDYSIPCNYTLTQFLQDPSVSLRAFNRQTKMLAGLGSFEYDELFSSEEEMLDVAKQHLQQMVWVGIHERLQDSLNLLETICMNNNIKVNIKTSNFTRHTTHPDISEDLLSSLQAANHLDEQLYAYALELFDMQLQTYRANNNINTNNSSLNNIMTINNREQNAESHQRIVASCASCTSPVIADFPSTKKSSSMVFFGEVSSFDSEFLREHPQCSFPQTKSNHIGTFTWYNSMFGCAYNYNWFSSSIFHLHHYPQSDQQQTSSSPHHTNFMFRTRSHYQYHQIVSQNYVVVFGAAQTMGIQSKHPYTAIVEQLNGLPVINIAYGGMGAGFFTTLLAPNKAAPHEEPASSLKYTVQYLVSHAKVVVVQAMSGHSESNGECQVKCHNMYCDNSDDNNVVSLELMLQRLNETARAKAKQESRNNWEKSHVELLQTCVSTMNRNNNKDDNQKKLLLFVYQSQFPFNEREDTQYPQFVTQDMVQRVQESLETFTIPFRTWSAKNASSSIYNNNNSNHHNNILSGTIIASLSGRSKSNDFPTKIPLTNNVCYSDPMKNLNKNCSYRHATDVCRMEILQGNCQCKALHVDYYPSEQVQFVTGVKISYMLNYLKEYTATSAANNKNTDKNYFDTATSTYAATLNSRKEVSFVADPPVYKLQFFALLTKGTVSLSTRTPLIAIDSACKNHPSAPIYIYIKENSNVVVEQSFLDIFAAKGCKLVLRNFNPHIFFIDSPLEGWISAQLRNVETGRYWYSHLTDLFRLVVLWRYGGFYLDTDVLFVKSVMLLPSRNVIGHQMPHGLGRLNNAISGFSAQHPVLEAAMAYVRVSYKANSWGCAGPNAITNAVENWPFKNCYGSSCVSVFQQQTFFPFFYDEAGRAAMFNRTVREGDNVELRLKYLLGNQTYTFHLWNKLTSRREIEPGSLLEYAYKQNCIVCGDLKP